MALDLDDNGRAGPLAEGVLMMRGLFGFGGAALTNDVAAVRHKTYGPG